MVAMQSTMDKLFEMRMTTMARAYRDLGDAPGAAEMGFDELLAMIVDAEWDARRVNNRVGGTSLVGVPSSHTTVRTVRYTAVPSLNTSLRDNAFGRSTIPARRAWRS